MTSPGLKDFAAWERMEAAYQADPTLGRARLARIAAVSPRTAQRFLIRNRAPERRPPKETAPQLDARWVTLQAALSPKELDALCQSVTSGGARAESRAPLAPKSSTYYRFAVITDTHIGHRKFREDWLLAAFEAMEDEEVEAILHLGDIVEGMSGRPGHVFELTHVGFQAQVGYAAELLGLAPVPVRAILGNHDLWFSGKGDAGVDVGTELELRLPGQFECIGYHEADVSPNGIKLKLWHGMDGKAYAKGYRGQKIVETLPGGGKPNLLLLGHAHDAAFYVTRNVHVFECGTFSLQSDFMRYTRKEAVPGWWLIEVWGEGSVQRVKPQWNPYFLES